MTEKQRKIIVTAALPYANGAIHLGHMLEYIQTDIWVRFQKLRGHDCQFVWASDAHGTPIMLSARKQGITAEELIEKMKTEHQGVFDDFQVAYDNFHSTHRQVNQDIVEEIFAKLKSNGHIQEKKIEQAYDAEAKMFLPDRFVKGTCPTCKSQDQNGDSCEVCGATYNPTDLIDPVSVVSGTTPIQKKTLHYFFALSNFTQDLQDLVHNGLVPGSMASKLDEWFEAGLQDWDITRDAPYFGFQIPGSEDKYFYVWLDAPVGYMASHKQLSHRTGKNDFPQAWQKNSEHEIYHFIGKDIVYFHALFWPAVLAGAGYKVPTKIFPHGFLTVDGKKMSKSRGTFIKARTYLDNLAPEYLRYYFAAKLNASIDDIDLNLEDFVQKVNSDLVGKLVNIASRCAGFIHKLFDGELADGLDDAELYSDMLESSEFIARSYEDLEYHRGMREIMRLADVANRYIDEKKPWIMAKGIQDDAEMARAVQRVCTQGLNCFRVLVHYLKPVIPELAKKAEAFLNITSPSWNAIQAPLLDHRIEKFKPLLTRVDSKSINAIVEASKEDLQVSPSDLSTSKIEALAPEISFDDFVKIDLRVARILSAEIVKDSNKLLKLILDCGDRQRVVFSGIKANYSPADIEGRLTVVVANLKPRKMRFGVSEGMVLCAGGNNSSGEEEIYLLDTDVKAWPGMRIT
ncbi:MAG: methionine--tRNA ligase [Gammaproteobacteria bacterium]|nr:methionine--tRNA ligase [Gammaproteobacteria bacterium]